jgi:phosphoribosylformimino-5-aminoimidazole carboxamide ribotide isomerase
MTRFRPCIDLHAGSVKQIVGGTLSTVSSDLKTNFTSEHPAAYYAELYKRHELAGAHVIMLGPGNEEAATQALSAWKGGMQVGGGITEQNCKEWIERGAEKVSDTVYLSPHALDKVIWRLSHWEIRNNGDISELQTCLIECILTYP